MTDHHTCSIAARIIRPPHRANIRARSAEIGSQGGRARANLQKEADIERLKQELHALRVVAPLLATALG